MYAVTNYKTKKELKEDFLAGKKIRVFQPGGIFPGTANGSCVIEGPYGVHKWYASVVVKDYIVVEIKG